MTGFGKIAFAPTGSIDLTLRGRDAFVVGPDGSLIPKQPEAGMRRISPASGVAASTAPAPSFGDVIARDAARRLQFANRYRAQQTAKQQQAPFGQRIGTALRQPLTSPTGMGLATAALTGLEMAGPQRVPTSTGQILARAGMAGLQAFGKATEAEQAREAAQQKLDIDRQRLEIERARAIAAASPDKTTLEKNLLAAGYKPGTQEYEQAVRAYLAKSTAPTVTVDVGAGSDEFKKAGIKYAFDRLAAEDKNISAMSTLENELDIIQNLIKGGAETGIISNKLIPVQQILVEAGLVGKDEKGKLADKELLQRSIARIIPNMRVAGSGSTSDYEMRMFAMAAPTFSRTSEGNRKIAVGMLQGIRYVKKRRALMDEYMADKELGDGTIIGFDKWADEKQGKVFKSFVAGDPDAEEEFKKAYQDGKLKVGDLIFNGSTYLFVTEADVEGF
jgi:hypothetical protein